MSTLTKPNHIGRKISRIRELRDMKQEALAQALGTNQQAVSAIENSETIDEEKLIAVAKALGVTVEAIKNFSDEAAINYFNSFTDNVVTTGSIFANNCTFNPLDKLVESYDENKKLYERLLKAEQDKIEYLEKLLKEK
ncbi:transcriptional regulator [Flavobacterium aquidurense]|jgi:transcriptional regulator with XRE-family HTH domain|uniref:helix-turn-helix domain-containing protein n=1 Tax=Flavobacterium aquidurense TaxID=362413 RepID=UPI0009173696|nr:helix-turn-helix transcriptional regulator [Flavobacterium aquidurense]OXA70832.1 transcriptional regulator [Flavobacterium aquidurense]SHF98405.1 DNA-binding transcriptional regulator, XRE-family HTH domain [Flavobacterium frigidimaris]